jgi:murein L,D-transpeptidase YcbB/YkuD
VRLKQLEINLVRLRSFGQNLGQRYAMANIPAAYVETVENNVLQTRHVAGVGKVDRQSPIMQAKIYNINFNPFWTVPASIIRKDLIPKMQKDPNYLTDQKIRIYNKAGQEFQPSQVNWNSYEATNYMFRQDPGGDFNSLGVVRIDIANPHGVYMHDTPAKGIFGDDFRFVSSGCIRIQNVREFVAWVLKDTPNWNRDQIEAAIRSGQRIDAKPQCADSGLLGLHHRLGDAGRRDAVPRRHLWPRRLRPRRGDRRHPGRRQRTRAIFYFAQKSQYYTGSFHFIINLIFFIIIS